jgi:hypothetical protein
MAHFLKRVVPIVLIAAVLTAAFVSPAWAAPEKPAHTPTSSLRLGGDHGLAASFAVSKDVTLALPWGELELTNAQFQVALGADGSVERLRGTADMPFPTFGLFDNARVVAPARADVGLELGKNLAGLNLALIPDRQYLFFNVDTAFGMAALTPGNSSEFAFSLDPGQRLTLVVDTVDPTAYLDGQLTLSHDDQVALLGGILEDTAIGPYVPDSLPIRERTQFDVSGKFSRNLAESYIKLTGAYVMDGGLLPARLGIEARPVQVKGSLTINRDGVLADGVVASSIEPERVLDGGANFQAFIPFRAGAGEAFASVKGKVAVPAAKLSADAGARIGQAGYELRGRLAAPFTPRELSGQAEGKVVLPDVAAIVKPAVSKASAALAGVAQQGAGMAGDVVAAGKLRLGRADPG